MAYRIMTRRRIVEHIAAQFESQLGYALDLDHPETFNEKLQWLKLNYRDPLMTRCTDKIGVRDYVADTAGREYLTEMLAVFDSAADIDFEALPSRFVLKTTNGSGTNIFCPDKDELDITQARAQLASWLRPSASQYNLGYEWGYKNVVPRSLCEEYLGDAGTIKDYKFFCFAGEPRLIYVSTEHGSKADIDMDFMDVEWRRLPYRRTSYAWHDAVPEHPKHLDVMVDLARRLAQPFPFVRVDLYEIDSRVLFSELTFYPANGTGAFENLEHDREIGAMLPLPRKRHAARPMELQRI